jgi:hypothetical protein
MTAVPRISAEALRELAEAHQVCTRPVVHEVTDTETGQVQLVPTPCGATLASKCRPCAQRHRILRMQQCREGWHLDAEPEAETDPEPGDDSEGADEPDEPTRRVRSTRRRQDAPDLPRLPMEDRTIGTAFVTPAGRTYRPSMFATFTLPSYGRVRADGSPVDPSRYDYRGAALDALHFPKLLDRLWQNLRRAVGYQVQYFAAVEAQRRLAPHLHAAVRGAIPRQTFRQVVEATYHQIWWPTHEQVVYDGCELPVWRDGIGYVDPLTGQVLTTFQEALDDLDRDPDARPAHVIRFGSQLDVQGIIATETDADRRVAYLTKYLAKDFGEAFGDETELMPRQRRHLDRLHGEVRFLPCSTRCSNWLRYGIQPEGAAPGMEPGACSAKAHDRRHLGCGGRRVLVSRKWTGKTLATHKADRGAVVRQVLEAAGVDVHEADRLSATVMRADGQPRYEWKIWNPLDATVPIYRQVMTRSIAERLRWKAEYEAAKATIGPDPPDRPASSSPQPAEIKVAPPPVKGERSESRSDTKCP